MLFRSVSQSRYPPALNLITKGFPFPSLDILTFLIKSQSPIPSSSFSSGVIKSRNLILSSLSLSLILVTSGIPKSLRISGLSLYFTFTSSLVTSTGTPPSTSGSREPVAPVAPTTSTGTGSGAS